LRPEFDALRKPSPYRRVRLTLSALSQSKLVFVLVAAFQRRFGTQLVAALG
jgi:hypothetical protein